MNTNVLQLVRLAMFALLIWFAFSWLSRVHVWLVIVALLFAGANALIVAIVRYHGSVATQLIHFPLVGAYMRWVCRVASLQVPSKTRTDSNVEQWICHSDADYLTAMQRLRQTVRGHDHAIEQIVTAIKTAVELRRLRKGKSGSPIASVLLHGSEGIGKHFLARMLAREMYRSRECLTIDCASEKFASIFGSAGSEGRLLKSVRQQPFQLICIVNLEMASDEFQKALQVILRTGRGPKSDGGSVSFEQTIVCMAMEIASQETSEPSPASSTQDTGNMIDLLDQHTSLSPALLKEINLTLFLSAPDPWTMAQVVAQQMRDEVSAHGLQLHYLDPLLIASEVLRLMGNASFSQVHGNVKKLLSKPLLEAARSRAKSLSLYVHSIS